MKKSDLVVGVQYLVTKGSDDETILEGDHLKLFNDGRLWCDETINWIEEKYVNDSLVGVELEIDVDDIKNKKNELLQRMLMIVRL